MRLIPHTQEAPTLVIGFVRGRFATTISNRITPHSEPCGVEGLRIKGQGSKVSKLTYLILSYGGFEQLLPVPMACTVDGTNRVKHVTQ